MRKSGILLMILFILLLPINTYGDSIGVDEANELPWDLMMLEGDKDLELLEEDLLVDFSHYKDIKNKDFTLPARIKVKYKFLNKSQEDKTFKLALPYVSSLEDLKPDNISIRQKEKEIPFKVHLGQYFYENLYRDHLEGFMDTINYEDYQPRNYDLDKKAFLYRFNLKAGDKENLYIKLKIDGEREKLLLNGFDGWIVDGGTSFTARIKEEGVLEVLVLEGRIDYDLKAYLSTNYARESSNHKMKLEEEEVRLGDYLEKRSKSIKQTKDSNYLDQDQLFHFYKMELDRRLGEMEEIVFLNDLSLHPYERRYLTLIGQVEFKAGEEKEITVEYTGKAVRDYPEYIDPLYRFDYKFNPGNQWASIGKLKVKVIPSHKSPYLIENNFDLARRENGAYEGSFPIQPREDFRISLYKREKIGRFDKIAKFTKDNMGLVIPLLYLLLFTTPRWIRKKLREKRDSFYEFYDEI